MDDKKYPPSRPRIEEFFPAGTTLSQAHKKYMESPELYRYIQALDAYADELTAWAIKAEMKTFNAGFIKKGEVNHG
jgi:hypothetical protein